MKKIIGFLIVLFCFINNVNLSAQNGTIRFGVMYFYPPFVAVNQLGQGYGLDIDIARALCKQLNKNCSFVPMPFLDLFTSLDNGTIDAAISAIIISKSRLQDYDFVPYYNGQMCFLTTISRNIVPTAQGLKGKTAGSMKGTAYIDWLHANLPDTKVLAYELSAEAISALAQGYIDVFLTDYLHAKWWVLNGNNQYKIVGQKLPLPENQGYGIAVKKGNTEMINMLTQAMQGIIANGTEKKIFDLYLNFDSGLQIQK